MMQGGAGHGQYGGGGYDHGYGYGAYGTGTPPPERGSRRRKLAAVAGSVYRAGVAAASELREQYSSARATAGTGDPHVSIPGSFPHVSIISKGEEQMVLFPTYAKRHVKEFGREGPAGGGPRADDAAAQMGMSEEEYWKLEWARAEDEKAVVDVDVRGWLYMPSRGPMTRRNRMLVGLARRLSGIPAPVAQSEPAESGRERLEELKEEQRIAREAREIERRGQEGARRGPYSESPGGSPPPSPPLAGTRTPTASQTDMTETELSMANANLMARLGPFMTTPLAGIPITIFFYNHEQSRSQTVLTDDSGHFTARVALEFVPTDVRILANENISTTKPVEVIDCKGVSLISDVDDTVKRSNISMGAREIFRNTFVRDLGDLTVDGVREWYRRMHDMGVEVHYCSNSPWQLFPVLATFFHLAGLPQGSIHLKQYSGMLQGIFEPVTERKKDSLDRIIRDFPERKFLLVGDSGEADLEVYTELVLANPGRILAVFIRDVTTPEQTGFFDASFSGSDPGQRRRQGTMRVASESQAVGDQPARRPQLPPRATATAPPAPSGPAMGTLIDFGDPEPASPATSAGAQGLNTIPRKPPPPRPAKPVALRSIPSDIGAVSQQRSPVVGPDANEAGLRPRTSAGIPPNTNKPTPPPPPPPRRRGTAPQQQQQPRNSGPNPAHTDIPDLEPPLPPLPTTSSHYHPPSSSETATPPNGPSSTSATTTAAANKKVDLWLRRLSRAHEILDAKGVKLYTWRRGEDVIVEAEGIVGEAMREMGVLGRKG